MTQCLIVGGHGMLGRELEREACKRGHRVWAPGHAELDVTDDRAVAAALDEHRVRLVFNCAAFTDVDGCETNRELAFEVNGAAVGRLGRAVEQRAGCRLLHVSTDYVFDGTAREPYREAHAVGPPSIYGASKLQGETELADLGRSMVVRTSWLFGPGGANFVDTIARRAISGHELRVVSDQVGCPTFTGFFAKALVELGVDWLEQRFEAPGVIHYRNRDEVSWYQFARAIVELWGAEVSVRPVASAELARPAPRPAYSVLSVALFEQLVGRQVEPWLGGLRKYRRGWSVHESKGDESEGDESKGSEPKVGGSKVGGTL